MDQRSHPHHRDHYYPNRGSNGPTHPNVPQKRNYKLLIDPFIVKGAVKTYRFEGIVEGDPSYPMVTLRDPRKVKIWNRSETVDIPVPRFKIDSNYVGEPPPLEVTILNVNDNIDHQFLHNEIVNKHQCGPLEDLQIFTHDLSRKHLGIARVIFEETECARQCVHKMNETALMGKTLKVFLDPFGKQCDKNVNIIISNLEEEARREEEAKEARKRPAPPPTIVQPVKEEPIIRKECPEKENSNHRYEEEQKNEIYSQAHYREHQQSHTNSYLQGSTSSSSSPATHFNYPPPVHLQSHPNTQPYNYPYQDYRPGYQQAGGLPANHQWPKNNHSDTIQHHSSPWQTSNPPTTPVLQEFKAEAPWEAKYPEEKSTCISPDTTGRVSKSHSEADSDGDKPNLDLETRIAMLLQNKDTNIAAPFLSLGEEGPQKTDDSSGSQKSYSSTDSDTAPDSGDDDRLEEMLPPLSTPPSPFISKEIYLHCYEAAKERNMETQMKDLIENQERLRKIKKKRHKKKQRHSSEPKEDDMQLNGLDDDRMSLSSLSTNEDPILHQDIPVPGNYSAPPPGYQPTYSNREPFPSYIPPVYPPHQQSGVNYWQANQGYGVLNNSAEFSYGGNYLSCTQYHPPSGSSYLPAGTRHIGVPPPGHELYHNWQAYQSVQGPVSSGHQSGHFHDPTVNSVLDKVIEALKVILKKDLNKRMIEGSAFKTYENWWDEHETVFKLQSEAISSSEPSATLRPEKLNMISNIFENKEGYGMEPTTTFSLGFRAAMPKMPSFRKIRKIKPPSPPCLDEDSKGIHSDEDSKQSSVAPACGDVSSSSDSEDAPMENKTTSSKPTGSKKLTWTSDESGDESEASSQSSNDESEESSSSESESSMSPTEEDESIQAMDVSTNSTAKELLQKEKEFEVLTAGILRDAIKTPERDSRAATPVPDAAFDDWTEVDASPKPSPHISPKPKKESPVKTVLGPKPLTAKISTPTKVLLHRLENETDTADEKGDDDMYRFSEVRHSPKGDSGSPVLTEHSYCLPWGPKDKSEIQYIPKEDLKKVIPRSCDHDYTRPRTPPKEKPKPKSRATKKIFGKENKIVKQIPNNFNKDFNYQDKPISITKFKNRNALDEYNTLYSFLIKGIDQEDIDFLKRSYERMMIEDVQGMWLNNTLWVYHPPTDVPSPPKKKRKCDDLPLHKTGCARTEGIYKVDSKQKQKHKFTFQEEVAGQLEEPQQSLAVLESSKAKPTQMSVSREVRSFQRRLLTAFGNETASDLLKFNQLKFRKKLLKFGKSLIHDWGLFALEAIASDEMVIEYVGQRVRPMIADLREINYEKMGIGSSYLFRIDHDNIIDATKGGNLARFINHSCNPNCYARIITVENHKKIVIYSKQPIACGEEITYDYKFPIEDEKIMCLCGASQCKGTLN